MRILKPDLDGAISEPWEYLQVKKRSGEERKGEERLHLPTSRWITVFGGKPTDSHQRPKPGASLRPIILRLHYPHVPKEILRRAGAKKNLEYQGLKIHIFPNSPPFRGQKERLFLPKRDATRNMRFRYVPGHVFLVQTDDNTWKSVFYRPKGGSKLCWATLHSTTIYYNKGKDVPDWSNKVSPTTQSPTPRKRTSAQMKSQLNVELYFCFCHFFLHFLYDEEYIICNSLKGLNVQGKRVSEPNEQEQCLIFAHLLLWFVFKLPEPLQPNKVCSSSHCYHNIPSFSQSLGLLYPFHCFSELRYIMNKALFTYMARGGHVQIVTHAWIVLGGCNSGGRAMVQLWEGHWFNSPAPQRACRSILEQDIEPQIAPDEQLAPCMAASAICVCACVCVCVDEWVNVTSVVKHFEQSADWN